MTIGDNSMFVNEIKYNYAYALTKNSNHPSITGHKQINILVWNLYYSDDLDIHVFESGADQYILLGYALDIKDGSLSAEEILQKLSKEENIDQALDYINGRYVLLVNRNEELYVYTDASALLPINYSSNKNIIASHDGIVKDLLIESGTEVNQIQQELKGSFDFTRFKDVFKFNPSLKLNLTTGVFLRYYPHSALVPKDINIVVKELEIYFSEMIEWLKAWNNEIILTLTGGYDSRVSLALTREISDKVEYLTYVHPNLQRLSERAQEIYDIDKFVTKFLSENMNLNHSLVELSDYDLKGEEREYYKTILQSAHSFPLIDYFKNKRQFNKVLHIKSTVFGMGKSDFPLGKNHNPQTYEEMKDFIHGVSKKAMALPEYNDILQSYYQRNLQSEGVGQGRHFFDIFHLESRMGNWHSNVTQETDPELIDFIFVNSRRIIDLLQSLSIQERKDKLLYKTLIKKYWPALLFVGFNEKSFNVDYTKVGLDYEYINGFKIYELNDLVLEQTEDHTVVIKPDSELVGPQNQYVFKAKNNTHVAKKLNIRSLFNKENGRSYINVKIMKLDNKTYKSIDIVDLFEGYEVTIEPFKELMIKIDYNHVFDKASWQQAGRVQISNI